MDAEGPQLGSLAPQVDLTALDGEEVRVGGKGRAQLLLFVSPGCHICEQVLPGAGALRQLGVSPIVVTDNDAEETALVYGRKRVDAPIVPGISITSAYEIPGTPYVVIVDSDGLVKAKGTVNNLEQLEGLVHTFHARRTDPLEHAS
jgi:methylamine dehydrogenase accessory protein MauD